MVQRRERPSDKDKIGDPFIDVEESSGRDLMPIKGKMDMWQRVLVGNQID